ncbi:glycosyltransferase [Chishuiella sp.]|uniref:glycosyltransferase family 2 protein n=1 Tax=Chishuiella sp. TaxID=1969467 RepID=UPI0028AB8FB2|nr:glycosyltransferase [Chishuiella sp.]
MQTMLPKVSVVTITWGHEKFIEQTLDSIFSQKYEGPIEIILSNDKSPDKTDEIINKYLLINNIPKNFEVKYTNHENNMGSMKNFIWSLQQATGKYIAICDGDDYWTDSCKLQKQVDFLERNEDFQMIFTNCKEVSLNGKINNLLKKISESKSYSDIDIFTNWIIPTSTVLYKNNFDKKDWNIIKDKKVFFGDLVLFLINANKGKIYGLIDETSIYRIHKESLTNNEKSIVYYEKLFFHLEYLSVIYNNKYFSYSKSKLKQQSYKNFRYFIKKFNIKSIIYFMKYIKYNN